MPISSKVLLKKNTMRKPITFCIVKNIPSKLRLRKLVNNILIFVFFYALNRKKETWPRST